MTEFFDLFISFISRILSCLGSYSFDVYGFQVNLLYVFLVLIIFSMCISIFWKGAKG